MLERLDQKMQKAVESSAFLQNAAMVMGWTGVVAIMVCRAPCDRIQASPVRWSMHSPMA